MSLLLLTITSSLISASTNTGPNTEKNTKTNTEATRLRAKSKASAPSSSKQEPFKKLDKQKLKSKPSVSKKALPTNALATRKKASKHIASSHAHAHDRFNRFDRIDANFASMFESIQKEMDNLSDIVKSVKESAQNPCTCCGHDKDTSPSRHNRIKACITPSIKSVDEKYYVQETVKKDVNGQNSYELTIGVPGYTTDDITVKFHDIKHKDKSGKTLEIYAKKQVIHEPTNTTEDKVQDVRVSTKFSQQFTSTSIINGKKRELIYKDGVLKIKLDLPIDVSGDYYTMSLENDELRICLPTNTDNEETKVLKFKETKTK